MTKYLFAFETAVREVDSKAVFLFTVVLKTETENYTEFFLEYHVYLFTTSSGKVTWLWTKLRLSRRNVATSIFIVVRSFNVEIAEILKGKVDSKQIACQKVPQKRKHEMFTNLTKMFFLLSRFVRAFHLLIHSTTV